MFLFALIMIESRRGISVAKVCSTMGLPASITNPLSIPPIRLAKPPASITAPTDALADALAIEPGELSEADLTTSSSRLDLIKVGR